MSEIRLILTILGIVMVVGMFFDRPLYALNLRLYRKYGWSSLADTWERRQAWWLAVCRVICALIAIGCYVAVFIL